MFPARTLARGCRDVVARRGISTSFVFRAVPPCEGDVPLTLIQLRKKQAKFQADNGLPVWLKGGFHDKVLYTATWVAIWIGLGMGFHFLYTIIRPPSWNKPQE